MDEKNKIASLSVKVPYKGAGNVIIQHLIPFDIYKEEEVYKAVPLLSVDERRKANLPPELVFTYQDGRPGSQRKLDGNFHVIEDVVKQLQQGGILDKG